MNNIIPLKNPIPKFKNEFFINPIDSPDILYEKLKIYLLGTLNIEATIDLDIVDSFSRDWSNLPGSADILFRPKNEKECSIILKI